MTDTLHPALLPAGLRDILPPHAQNEAEVVDRLTTTLALHGYERVKPPLVEFEESLLGGPGAAMAQDTFRLMDPISQRMIGVRADMTLQIARIATVRLAKLPRPLRLSYAGQVLRVSGTQLRPERQFGQVGVELIGSDELTADAEVILLAAEALVGVGVDGLSVDLTVPKLVPNILAALSVSAETAERLRGVLDHKDAAGIDQIGGPAAGILRRLMAAAGPAPRVLAVLTALDLPAEAKAEIDRLAEIVRLIGVVSPDLLLTVDPIENRGFEYHTGVSFTIFARGLRGELGRGGRYRAGGDPAPAEPATGFTLYTDTILRAVAAPKPATRVFLPFGGAATAGAVLRAAGWVTVAGLAPVADAAAEARRLACTHILDGGAPVAV